MTQTILITMTIGNPPSNPLHPKGSGGDFLSPLLSHDMRGDILNQVLNINSTAIYT